MALLPSLWRYGATDIVQQCAAMSGTPLSRDELLEKGERSRPFLIPVRIIAVCDRGHIEDFPFMEWVHRNKPIMPDCDLRFLAGRSSSLLTGIKISCSCGEEKTLAGIFDFDQQTGGALQRIGYRCQGGSLG